MAMREKEEDGVEEDSEAEEEVEEKATERRPIPMKEVSTKVASYPYVVLVLSYLFPAIPDKVFMFTSTSLQTFPLISFFCIEHLLSGLVHISQITREKRLEGEDDIKAFLSEEQEVWVKVTGIEVQRISTTT